MRIAFDIRGLDGSHGGKGIWTANVLKSILNSDRENEYFLYTNKEWDNEYSYLPNVHVVRVRGKGIFYHRRLYRALLKDGIDVLIATESYIVPFLHDPKKLKVALIVHDLVAFKSPAKHQRRATWIERLTLKTAVKKSRWIFTVSEYTKKDLIQMYSKLHLEDKTTVVYAGIREIFSRRMDANKIISVQRRYNLEPDYVMMAGTLEPRKNILGALEAYSLLSPKNQQIYRFVVIGKKGWYYKEIFQKVKSLNLQLRVKFLEYIPDDDLVTLMQGAKIFLFPSFYEGFGLPILEAMQCGVPVLASRVTSIPELGVNAIHYADPTDAVDIADGITQLLENEEYRTQLRNKGYEQVKHFSWGKTAAAILNAIARG
ncbi:glycosyltransferase family 4 protein [Candidatus Peregrinibacteria bacterium]|nr:glycosyltransferase family 4 protein [Candidatus Peregrinibacteria bacterium]